MCRGQVIRLPQGKIQPALFSGECRAGRERGGISRMTCPNVCKFRIERADRIVGQSRFRGPVDELTYSVNNTLLQIDPGFIKRAPVAWFCSHRHEARDRIGRDDEYNYRYLFKYALPIPAGQNLTLPNNPRIGIVAVSVAHDEKFGYGRHFAAV